MTKITDYFSDWEGWYCEIEGCGEVIENTTKVLQGHLKEKHGIEVELIE